MADVGDMASKGRGINGSLSLVCERCEETWNVGHRGGQWWRDL